MINVNLITLVEEMKITIPAPRMIIFSIACAETLIWWQRKSIMAAVLKRWLGPFLVWEETHLDKSKEFFLVLANNTKEHSFTKIVYWEEWCKYSSRYKPSLQIVAENQRFDNQWLQSNHSKVKFWKIYKKRSIHISADNHFSGDAIASYCGKNGLVTYALQDKSGFKKAFTKNTSSMLLNKIVMGKGVRQHLMRTWSLQSRKFCHQKQCKDTCMFSHHSSQPVPPTLLAWIH